MSWYFLHRSNVAQRDDFPKIVLKESRSLPIADLDVGKAKNQRMLKLVEGMLVLQKQLVQVKSAAQKNIFQRQIDATDVEIDRLVYDLYDLTAEEIALVEGASTKPA
jgi:hypothetical protein